MQDDGKEKEDRSSDALAKPDERKGARSSWTCRQGKAMRHAFDCSALMASLAMGQRRGTCILITSLSFPFHSMKKMRPAMFAMPKDVGLTFLVSFFPSLIWSTQPYVCSKCSFCRRAGRWRKKVGRTILAKMRPRSFLSPLKSV